jgi:hypothetical protein
MSFFSDLFGDSGPSDLQIYLQQQQAQQRRDAEQAKADAAAQQAKQDAQNAALRTSSSTAARDEATRYFQDRGLDPSQYSGDIDAKIQDILGTTAVNDPNIGSYFSNLGQSLYQSKQDAARTAATRAADTAFGPDYANSRITSSLDDPILGDINTEQRGRADSYLTNLLKRGVITQAGYQGGEGNLDLQGSRVRDTLNDLAGGILSTGRQGLTDVSNRAHNAASNLNLGSNFDVGAYTNEANKSFDDFVSGLGDKIRGSISQPLYDTSGLAAIAGAASGAQNTKFDPQALAGVLSNTGTDSTENEDALGGNSKTRSVF